MKTRDARPRDRVHVLGNDLPSLPTSELPQLFYLITVVLLVGAHAAVECGSHGRTVSSVGRWLHNYLTKSCTTNTRVTKSESGTFVDTRVAIRSRQVVAEYALNRASIADVE